ncbi:hypothetical protein SNEBB_003687, partial [Seison nebaliae]
AGTKNKTVPATNDVKPSEDINIQNSSNSAENVATTMPNFRTPDIDKFDDQKTFYIYATELEDELSLKNVPKSKWLQILRLKLNSKWRAALEIFEEQQTSQITFNEAVKYISEQREGMGLERTFRDMKKSEKETAAEYYRSLKQLGKLLFSDEAERRAQILQQFKFNIGNLRMEKEFRKMNSTEVMEFVKKADEVEKDEEIERLYAKRDDSDGVCHMANNYWNENRRINRNNRFQRRPNNERPEWNNRQKNGWYTNNNYGYNRRANNHRYQRRRYWPRRNFDQRREECNEDYNNNIGHNTNRSYEEDEEKENTMYELVKQLSNRVDSLELEKNETKLDDDFSNLVREDKMCTMTEINNQTNISPIIRLVNTDIFQRNNLPFIKILLNDKPTVALLDSGASRSCIRTGILATDERKAITKTNNILSSANNVPIKHQGLTKTTSLMTSLSETIF